MFLYVLVPILDWNELLAGFFLDRSFFATHRELRVGINFGFWIGFRKVSLVLIAKYLRLVRGFWWFLVDLEETKTKKWIPGDDFQFGRNF